MLREFAKMKRCSGVGSCGRLLPATKEYFHGMMVKRRSKYGFHTWRGLRPKCKECRSIQKIMYRLDNPCDLGWHTNYRHRKNQWKKVLNMMEER